MIKSAWEISDLVEHASVRGGLLLTRHYSGTRGMYTWKCGNGHTWKSTWGNVLKGRWCMECSRGKNSWLNKMRALAKSKGGECLSISYLNSYSKLKWKCGVGHVWMAKPNNISIGKWCPQCALLESSARQRRKIVDLQRYAESLGGQCLDDSLFSAQTKVRWRCSVGHVWLATTQSVMGSGNWCPKCGHQRGAQLRRTPGRLETLQKIANDRGGKLISTEYKGANHLVQWLCGNGHQWMAKPAEIMRGRWCPSCSSGLGERICREYFEQIFQTKFPKSKPKWLRNMKGTLLELDGYSKTLKLAFEHQGSYHYKVDKRFSVNSKALKARQISDQAKRNLCKENGITLIEIPEIPTMTALEDLPKLIITECTKQGVFLNKTECLREINLAGAYLPTPIHKELSQLAKRRGGRLLDAGFKGWDKPLQWQCDQAHQWYALPGSIKFQETWCPECAGVIKKSLIDMQKLAASRGGLCVSLTYKNARSKLLWQCSGGHRWLATPTSIASRGSWCPYCAGQRGNHLSIDAMRLEAIRRGGVCLSSNYKNSKTKLRWRCANNHEWDAMPLNVINKGSWCPRCANERNRKSIKNGRLES